MERNLLKKKWYVLFNELKERWPDLTRSDVDYISGNREKLQEIVQLRRHISAEEARRDVEEFLDRLELRQNIA
jgi:hypothetical protein